MATVVIIHAADDTLPARALAEKLRGLNLQVVIEKPPGEDLRAALKSAQLAIALWSPRSVGHAALTEDVAFARGKGKVFHALMQGTTVPDAFTSDKSANLTGWRGEDDFTPWRELAKMVSDQLRVPMPPVAPKPPSGFFQPGRVGEGAAAPAAPAQRGQQQQRQQQRAPQSQQQRAAAPRPQPAPRAAPARNEPAEAKSGGGRGMLIGIIAFVVIAAAGGGGYYFWQQSQSATAVSAEWDAVATNDADAIRAFLAGDPGDYRDEAQAALAELEERSYEAANEVNTIEAFEEFLNDFPESQHAIAARGRIAELQLATPAEPIEGVMPVEGATVDPDLVPPGSTPDTGGPAQIAPPAPAPAPEPAPDLPTN